MRELDILTSIKLAVQDDILGEQLLRRMVILQLEFWQHVKRISVNETERTTERT